MFTTTPKSHLYRLAGIIVVMFVAFLALKQWATPASWDHENWYRKDALSDIAALPMAYGGNESCQECHEGSMKKFLKYNHRALSCESCHGPLADHITGAEKIADAFVDKSRAQCENCHDERINRPKGFPQYSKNGKYGKEVGKHENLNDVEPCLKCHDAHDPTP